MIRVRVVRLGLVLGFATLVPAYSCSLPGKIPGTSSPRYCSMRSGRKAGAKCSFTQFR